MVGGQLVVYPSPRPRKERGRMRKRKEEKKAAEMALEELNYAPLPPFLPAFPGSLYRLVSRGYGKHGDLHATRLGLETR